MAEGSAGLSSTKSAGLSAGKALGLSLETQPPEFAAVELRITARCLRSDLRVDPAEASVEDLAQSSAMVRKFFELRTSRPKEGQEAFASASRSDIYTIHAGQLRGATWYDREYDVTWLLGFGLHRAGDHSDAYAVMARLDQRGQLLPAAEDYEALFRERDARQLPEMVTEMRALLNNARATPDRTHSTVLSVGVRVSLYVVREGTETEGVEEFHLAVSARNLEDGWLSIIRTSLWPSDDTSGWEYTKDFPGCPASAVELRFKHWHDLRREGGAQ